MFLRQRQIIMLSGRSVKVKMLLRLRGRSPLGRSLTDRIEEYIKKLFSSSGGGRVEINRGELAQIFCCVPSQINYVLATRFTLQQGYLVESRRGGRGYVRIEKLALRDENIRYKVASEILGNMVSQQVAEGLINRLHEEGLIAARERALMRAAVDARALSLPLPQRDLVRASVLRAMILALVRGDSSS